MLPIMLSDGQNKRLAAPSLWTAAAVAALGLTAACIDPVAPVAPESHQAGGPPSSLEPAPGIGNVVVGRSEGGGYVLSSRPSVPLGIGVSGGQDLALKAGAGAEQ